VRASVPEGIPMLRYLCWVLLFALLTACASVPNKPTRLSRSSVGCMQAVVREKVAEDLPEKRAHCLAGGLIARYCSITEAYMAGSGKELGDVVGRGDAQWEDWRADRAGIACARIANNDAELEECCARSGY
jgi:hypothetical protein